MVVTAWVSCYSYANMRTYMFRWCDEKWATYCYTQLRPNAHAMQTLLVPIVHIMLQILCYEKRDGTCYLNVAHVKCMLFKMSVIAATQLRTDVHWASCYPNHAQMYCHAKYCRLVATQLCTDVSSTMLSL